jgi:AcrR family transcriptional regulator
MPKEDIRVTNTKTKLRRAIVEMLREMPFESITVKRLLERANVSKKAFYTHYVDIYDMVVDAYLSINPVYIYSMKPVECKSIDEFYTKTLDSLTSLMVLLKENAQLAKVIFTNLGVSHYFEKGITLSSDVIEANVRAIRRHLDCDGDWVVSAQDCARYCLHGYIGIVRDWIMDGFVEQPEVIAKRAVALNLYVMGYPKGAVPTCT